MMRDYPGELMKQRRVYLSMEDSTGRETPRLAVALLRGADLFEVMRNFS